ncbi:hypothetical protein OIDMADRAFT_35173 [Oidiodendron maius Zn]|uniref:Cytochrome P450 n=1 Tax=Oidiodendron maius (strain Zn) TaxID=913774 RepID=A0A0C3C5I0_OIDMZ|nr:hypothetical protein OIDMADRAFT_35173 [Oidiodendron maius Zn]
MSGRADFCVWIREQHLKTRSPISQVFLNLGKKPTVLIADHRETRDIMTNRTKDFDRGFNSKAILDLVAGNYQLTLKTGPEWRLHRRLLQDTMTPVFLQTVAAPSVHTKIISSRRITGFAAILALLSH